MLKSIFQPDNFLFRSCNKLFDLVLLSVLWLALCLPVVTAGPATAALYYAVVKCIRRGEPEPYRNFFHAFRENLRQGAVAGLIAAVVAGVLWLGWAALGTAAPGDSAAVVWRAAYGVALLVSLGTICYLFPLLSRFSFRLSGLFFASFRAALSHLPSTAVLVLMTVEAATLCLRYRYPVALAPGVTALLASLFLERIFKQYMPPAPPAAVETAPKKPHPAPGEEESEPEPPETPWYS